MKLFVGTKILLAQAMTLGEYNSYRGWDLPKGENPERPGFLVEYPLTGEDDKPNHKDHEGYISWSPATAFEASYISLPAFAKEFPEYQQRVVAEEVQLNDKVEKLQKFIGGSEIHEKLSTVERAVLRSQLTSMEAYQRYLRERINGFQN